MSSESETNSSYGIVEDTPLRLALLCSNGEVFAIVFLAVEVSLEKQSKVEEHRQVIQGLTLTCLCVKAAA
jgi:uncharacterized membrane protein